MLASSIQKINYPKLPLKIIFIIAILFFFNSISFPQIIDSPKHDLKNFFKVGGDVISSPAHYEGKDWLVLSSTLGLTAASFLIDEDIRSFALQNQGSFGDALFKIDDFYHIEFMSASIAAIYIYGMAAKNPDVRNLGLRLGEATIYASTITLLSKFIIGRERPAQTSDALVFSPLNTRWDFSSLPSGHTTLSFAYSTVLASAYNNFFWKFGWFSLAALVGTARVYNNKHWFSDVLLGAAIGCFVGDFVNKHDTNQKEKNMDLPVSPAQTYSFSFGFAF